MDSYEGDVESINYDRIPNYLVAADNHDAADGDFTLTDFIKGGAGAVAGAAVGSAIVPVIGTAIGGIVGALTAQSDGNYAKASLMSGANSFYNTGVAINNWFGGDAEAVDNQELMDSIDDDLGTYYSQHKELADLSGFIAGSFIPGQLALGAYSKASKMLAVAKEGNLGVNMSEATGLLIDTQKKALSAAISEITSSNATFSILNQNTFKALAAGVGEQAIQAAVFETAVTATMFKSPILEDMDVVDLGKNILFGAVIGGAAGGFLEGIGTYGKIKAAKITSDSELNPYTHISELPDGAKPDERILLYSNDKFNTPAVDSALTARYGDRPARLLAAKISTIDDNIRSEYNTLANGDTAVGNLLSDLHHTATSVDEVGSATLGLRSAIRLRDTSATERALGGLANKVVAGTITPEETALLNSYSVKYLRTYGEGAGVISNEAPSVLRLADTLKKGESIVISSRGVKAGSGNNIKLAANKVPDFITAKVGDIEARYLWALHNPALKDGTEVAAHDIPLLEKLYTDTAHGTPSTGYNIKLADGSINNITTREDLLSAIEASKKELIAKLAAKGATSEQIAIKTNVRVSYLERTAFSTNKADDILAMQSYAKEHYAKINAAASAKGTKLRTPKSQYDILLQPQTVKLGYDTTPIADINGNVLAGMAAIKQKQVIYRNAAQRVFNSIAGQHANEFFRMPEEITMRANSLGAGQGGLSFANGSYGTPASFFERIGQATHNLLVRNTNEVHATLEPILNKIRTDLNASLELSTILNKVRSTPEKYILSEDGSSLVWRETNEARRVDHNAQHEIPISNDSVREYIAAHIKTNASRVNNMTAIRNAQGLQHRVHSDIFYAPPVNPKDYPHFAFVIDDSITGTGHVSMIHAATQNELDALIAKVPAEFTTVTKGQSERWHKAYGDYQNDLALHENYIDSALASKGVSASFFPATDQAKIVDDLMKWHIEKERQVVREGVSLLYSKEFAEFRRLGEQYTDLATSKYGRFSNLKIADEVVHNPYVDYIKTALDVQKSADARVWTDLNTKLDANVSNIWNKITGTFNATKSVDDLVAVNKAMQEAGIKTAYYDAALDALANHQVPKGVLSSFIQKSNALLSTISLRMDFLNSVNNVVGGAVLGGAEFNAVIRAIRAGNADAVGELASLATIKVPGTGDSILAPKKLLTNAFKNWFDPAIRQRYFDAGFTTRHTAEYHQIIDDMAVRTNDTASTLSGRLNNTYNKIMSFGDKAEHFTGNKFAEEFTRFISADVMRQVTDLAVKHVGMDAKLADSYISTFVNRVNGNYLASQRPLAFQGPIGQAVGLFQTYQFNFMQQLLRHVADGRGKNAAMLLGLQGTIYGMNGLPAFQAINTHLIGTLAGNTEHKDISSFTYGAVSKDAADWLMYGAASNILGLFHPDLKTNLYTRGDINPRNLTILPTSFADIPIVGASSKFFSNLKETASKLAPNIASADGASTWTTFLQGLEHNGVNRPLAGLAQTLEAFGNPDLQAFSTDNKGALSATNDLLSLTTFGRILGGKPMDEAIAIDAGFRNTVYQAKDADIRKQLGEQIRTTVIEGRHPSEEQIAKFTHEYVKAGGKQQNFNKFFMSIYKNANTAQANIIAQNLKTPYAKRMQELMGGNEFRDFNTN